MFFVVDCMFHDEELTFLVEECTAFHEERIAFLDKDS